MAGTMRLLAAAAVLSLAACGEEPPPYQEQSYVFGTLVEVAVHGESEPRARQAANEVLQEFQRLHNLLHAWQPSELSALNAAFAAGRSMTVSPELAAMLRDAAQLAQQSQGLFNPAIGGLVQAWGFQADEFGAALPGEKQIAALVAANPQMSDIVFNPSPALPLSGEGFTVGSNNKAVRLDLGGYAKGYALDRAAEILRRQGIRNALINIGGNVLALGKRGERPWRIGIQHPRKPGALATLELHDGEALGTSGDYQRYFELDGKRYCHLIDPRNGHPAQGVQAATVLIRPLAIRLGEQTTPAKSLVMTRGERAGVLSDALSKPLFIAGTGGWRTAAAQMGATDAMLVDGQGGIHLTADLQKRLEFADKSLRVEVLP
jgi:thiamine biosynthesis lipoprotein